MACHYISLKDEKEFYEKLQKRDFELVHKMTKCVMSAAARKKDKIDIFEITFRDHSVMTFSCPRSNYREFLEHALLDYIKQDTTEYYQYCAIIRDQINEL